MLIIIAHSQGDIWVTASVLPSGDGIVVQVNDTGIGIPQDRLSTVFDPFEKVDMSPKGR